MRICKFSAVQLPKKELFQCGKGTMLVLVASTASSLAADRVGGSLQPDSGAPSRSAKLPDKTIGYCALLPHPAPSCQRPTHLWYPAHCQT